VPDGLKELVVVLAIATVVFGFAKPVALQFSSEVDFTRRRNVWFILTAAAFLSPSFWLFALVAVPLLVFAGRKDTNPIALYLFLLNVIPVIEVDIPTIGIRHLFALDIYRLLSLCVLIPALWRWRGSKGETGAHRLDLIDYLLLGFGAVQALVFIPPDLPQHVLLLDSATNIMRRACLFFIDTYLVYFAVRRCCPDRRALLEALAAFCLSCALMAGEAAFESLWRWLLYGDIGVRWAGDVNFYAMRGGMLRALASSGNALALGYLLAIAFGFWLYLKSRIESRRLRLAVPVLLWLGMLAAYSRGPWLGAVLIYFTFAALGSGAPSRLFKALSVAALIGGVIAISPLGRRITDVFPFLGGHIDQYNVAYRERLAQQAWALIQQNPIFGDRLAYLKMQDLRQGMGIIDLVNTYAEMALYYGLFGLALFLGPLLVAVLRAYRVARNALRYDPDLASLGIMLSACVVGTLTMLASCSFILGYQKMFYILTGLLAAYASIGRLSESR
jgi:O-antigen ligase